MNKLKNILTIILGGLIVAGTSYAMTASFQGVPVPSSFPAYLVSSSTATASSTWISSSTLFTNLNLGDIATLASSTFFKVANNLSEGNATTMRSNLGLGTIATQNANSVAITGGNVVLTTVTSTNAITTNQTIGTLNGILKGTSGAVGTATNGTDYTLTQANTCGAGYHINSLAANGSSTCSADSGGGGSTSTSITTFTIEYPTASENDTMMIFNASSTIKSCYAVNKTAGDTVTFNIGYSSSRATATSSLSKLFTSDQTVTATTTPAALTVNGSSTAITGYPLMLYTTAASSTQFTVSCQYTTP